MLEKFLFRMSFYLAMLLFMLFILLSFLKPIFITKTVIFPYSLHPFDICSRYPQGWYYIKIAYIVFYFLSGLILSNSLYISFFKDLSFSKISHTNNAVENSLSLYIGKKADSQDTISISEKGLYQNFLITRNNW